MTLPPGPRAPWPIQALHLLRDPIGYHNGLRRRYGPVAHGRFLSGEHAAYVMEPALAAEVLRGDPEFGKAGEARARFLEPLIGSHTLLTLDGEQWERHREMLGDSLHGSRLETFTEDIAAIARGEIDRWPEGEIELEPSMTRITFEAILRAVFGLEGGPRLERLRRILPEMIDAGPIFAFLSPGLRARVRAAVARGVPARLLPGGRFVRLRAEVDELLLEEIAERRLAGDLAERADVHSSLILARDGEGNGLGDEELRDELLSLLVAGYETTASSLCWAFERLVQHPDALDRLRTELEAGDQGYLRAVAQEALRYRAVGHLVPRTLKRPIELGGYRIPAEWNLAVSTAAIHGDPENWESPEDFRPERFIDERPNRKAWLPFGGGRRYCFGAQLAMLELRVVVAEVVRTVELGPPSRPERTRIKGVVLRPSRGARVTLRRGPRPVNAGTPQRRR